MINLPVKNGKGVPGQRNAEKICLGGVPLCVVSCRHTFDNLILAFVGKSLRGLSIVIISEYGNLQRDT